GCTVARISGGSYPLPPTKEGERNSERESLTGYRERGEGTSHPPECMQPCNRRLTPDTVQTRKILSSVIPFLVGRGECERTYECWVFGDSCGSFPTNLVGGEVR